MRFRPIKLLALLLVISVIINFLAITVLAQSEKVVPPPGPGEFPSKGSISNGFSDSGTLDTGALPAELPAELQSVLENVQPLIGKLSLLVGGLFGLYLILILVRIHYERKQIRILRDIRYNLDQLNLSKGISCSQHRPGFFKRFFSIFRKSSAEEEIGPTEEEISRVKKKKKKENEKLKN